MAFLETPSFPLIPGFGYTVTPSYLVTVTERAGGYERRYRDWSRPLHRFDCNLTRKDTDVATLLNFWHAVGGMEYGFRFKDWGDYKSCAATSTVAITDQPLVLITGSTYQLTKRYTSGANTQDRDIKKPVSGTIRIADAGVEKTITTHWTIDTATGIVTLLYTPAGTLTWGGEFDVPVRFDSELPIETIDRRAQSVQFALKELRL